MTPNPSAIAPIREARLFMAVIIFASINPAKHVRLPERRLAALA
jgi:hypothetical protein